MRRGGGFTLPLGDLVTAVQENISVEIVVFNNGAPGLVELDMTVEGLPDACTNLKNPDLARGHDGPARLGRGCVRDVAGAINTNFRRWGCDAGPPM